MFGGYAVTLTGLARCTGHLAVQIHHQSLSAQFLILQPSTSSWNRQIATFAMAVMKSTVATPVSAVVTAAASSLSCEWTSAAQLVGQIQADKLIIPDVVSQCADVCQVAFNSTTAPGVSTSLILLLITLLTV